MYKKIVANKFFWWSLYALLIVLINFSLIKAWLDLPFIGGWDGASYGVVADQYTKTIFPAVWGWLAAWYGGMPFPQFYPPLLFLIVGLLKTIFYFAPTILLIKILVIALLIIVPALIYRLSFFIFNNTTGAALAGIIATVYMSAHTSYDAYIGITVSSTLNAAMISQLLGFVLMLTWLPFLFKLSTDKSAQWKSAPLLGLIFLTNLHIAEFSVFFFCAVLLLEILLSWKKTDSRKAVSILWNYSTSILIGLLLGACWLFPLLSRYTFFSGVSLTTNIDSIHYISQYVLAFTILVMACIYSYKEKSRNVFIFSSVLLLTGMWMVLSIFIPESLFPLPLHSTRWIGPDLLLMSIIGGYFYSRLPLLLRDKNRTTLYLCMALTLFGSASGALATFWYPKTESNYYSGLYENYNQDKVPELLAATSTLFSNPDPVVIESNGANYQPLSFTINSLLGSEGVLTTFSNFRESSVNSLFLTPLRNGVSQIPELWDARSYLPFLQNPDKDPDNFLRSLNWLHYLGVGSIISDTAQSADKLSTYGSIISLKKDLGKIKVFQFTTPASQADVLTYQPALLFAPLKFRERNDTFYDYARFQEELLSQDPTGEIIASPTSKYIDENKDDIDNFKTIIIADYSYKNLNNTLDMLRSYLSDGGTILLVEDNNALFLDLKNLNNPSIKIFPKITNTAFNRFYDSPSNYATPFETIIDYLDSHKIPVSNESSTTVSFSQKQNEISILVSNNPTHPVPVWIKRSYFPDWIRPDGKPVYLATPGYILTYADNSFTLYFSTPWQVWCGIFLSFCALFLIIWKALTGVHK